MGGNASYSQDITLNGVFTIFEAIRLLNSDRKIYFSQEQSLKNISNFIYTKNEEQLDSNFPFYKKRINFSKQKYSDINFVIIILESYDKDLMNLYPNSVPYFNNELKKNGVYFDNAYASGRRSLMGLSSLMLSIPYIQGLMPLNSGLEAKEFTRIGNLLNNYGYHSLYIANEGKNEERISELVKYFGIDEFYSKEDITITRNYPYFEKGYDIDGLEFFYDKINNINSSFVSFFWVTSTHLPYHQVLSEKLKIYDGNDIIEQYLNRLRYTDYALENFFKKASETSWFKNTIFILVPDHRAVLSERKATRDIIGEEYFSSFILLYAPYILTPEENPLYCNIGDIIPTIIDLAHIDGEYSSFYTSLFDNDRKDYTFIYGEDNNIYTFAPNHRGIVNILEPNIDNMSELDKAALSLGEILYSTVKNNKFVKK